MDAFLLNRQLGQISPQAFAAAQNQKLLGAIQLAPNTKFAWRTVDSRANDNGEGTRPRDEAHHKAHVSGVNSLVIDRFEGR